MPKIKKGLKGRQGLPRATTLSRKPKPAAASISASDKARREASAKARRETSGGGNNKPPRKRPYYETSADNTSSLFVDQFDPTDDNEAPIAFVSLPDRYVS